MFLTKKVLILGTVAVTLFLTGCGDAPKKAAVMQLPPLEVETIIVEKKNYPFWVQYTGMTKASSDQEIRARVAGRLQKVYFKDGDSVKKGDKLFLIEPSN